MFNSDGAANRRQGKRATEREIESRMLPAYFPPPPFSFPFPAPSSFLSSQLALPAKVRESVIQLPPFPQNIKKAPEREGERERA